VIGNHDTGNLGPIIEVAPPAARQILIEARYPGKQAEGPLRGRIEPFDCPDPNPHSGVQYTVDARHRVAAEPDRAVLELDRDQAVAAEAPALTRNIRARIQDTIPAHERSVVTDPSERFVNSHIAYGFARDVKEKRFSSVLLSRRGSQISGQQPMDVATDRNAPWLRKTFPPNDHHVLVQIDVLARELQCFTNENAGSI